MYGNGKTGGVICREIENITYLYLFDSSNIETLQPYILASRTYGF